MIQLNRTTIWKDFSQYISKYMALKIWYLKYFEQCIKNRSGTYLSHNYANNTNLARILCKFSFCGVLPPFALTGWLAGGRIFDLQVSILVPSFPVSATSRVRRSRHLASPELSDSSEVYTIRKTWTHNQKHWITTDPWHGSINLIIIRPANAGTILVLY